MFSRFLNAIQGRLAGVLVAGVFRRFEMHQAIQEAELQASLESRAKALREQGCIAAAQRLEERFGPLGESGGAEGFAFANALLADSYDGSDKQAGLQDSSLVVDASSTFSDEPSPTKRRGKKIRPESDD